MAKKSIDDSLLTGGSISEGSKSKAKANKSKSKKGIAKNTQKVIKSIICCILVVALVACYFFTGIARKGIISNLGIPAKTLTVMTVSNGDQKANIKVGTYNFYFFTSYNNLYSQIQQMAQYGIDPAEYLGIDVDMTKTLASQTYVDEESGEEMTWAKHMQDEVIEGIENTYTFYLAAVAANDGSEPAITDEQQAEIDEAIENYRQSAYDADYELDAYLTRMMGKGVNEKLVRTELERQYIAQNYEESLTEDASAVEYTSDDLNAYKDEHKAELESVDIMLFECTNEDDAIAFKEALNADGSNFGELASQYSEGDFYTEAYKDPAFSTMIGMTRETLETTNYAFVAESGEGEEHSHPGLDWLYSTDRQAGDVYQDSTSVVYVLSPVSVADTKVANVRHILVSPDMGDVEDADYTQATAEQWAAAYEKAESILNEWKSGDATEDSFSALAQTESADTGSATTGGLIETTPNGNYVNSFAAWSFDANRQAGDTAIVQSAFGYHIMYYVGTGDVVWEKTAKEALTQTASTAKADALRDEYTSKTNGFATMFYCQKDVDISR